MSDMDKSLVDLMKERYSRAVEIAQHPEKFNEDEHKWALHFLLAENNRLQWVLNESTQLTEEILKACQP